MATTLRRDEIPGVHGVPRSLDDELQLHRYADAVARWREALAEARAGGSHVAAALAWCEMTRLYLGLPAHLLPRRYQTDHETGGNDGDW